MSMYFFDSEEINLIVAALNCYRRCPAEETDRPDDAKIRALILELRGVVEYDRPLQTL